MKKITFLIVTLLAISNLANSQHIYFQEGFENEINRNLWTQESTDAKPAKWNFLNGGAAPPGDISNRLPANAISGVFNTMFFKQSPITYKTYLISPPFSLELAEKPQFRFYYAQYPNEIPGGDKDNSKFTLCYRTPEYNNKWVPIKDYTLATSGWVFDSLPLHDSIKYVDMQIGFLGISSTVSFGSCIDSIMIIETDTVDKYVDQVLASHPNQDILPTGSDDNPILKIKIPVKGNHSELILKQIKINALLETEQVVPANGVRIYITQTEHFTRDNPIGDTISFIGGQALFTNLNYSLPFGINYIWVTVDIAKDTQHKFKDLRVDVKVPKNGILLNDKTFSSESDLDPNGYRIVNESVFYDDFEAEIDTNWDLITEFEIDSAYGKGGYLQNPDPNYATSGFKIMGTDLSGLGFAPGDYEPYVPADGYTSTSPTFDCSYFKDLNLQFYRWLNVSADDYVKIEYSTDDKISWKILWHNELNGNKVPFSESNWHFIEHGLSSALDRAPSVTFRFTTGPTGTVTMHSGWNIDNFAITGNYVNHDVGVSAFLAPNDGSGLSNSETVTVKIKNFGYDPSSNKIPVGYSINNGYTWITDTLEKVLDRNEEVTFSFSQKLDLSTPGIYRLLVSTLLNIDEDSRNDLIDTTLYSFPYASLPYFEDFENDNGVWRAGGTTIEWKHGKPVGTKINTAFSGNNAWVTNLSGDYENNSSTWLESPSFNFTNIDKPIFECMLYTAGEIDKDGLSLYYSLDEGANWVLVPKTGSYNWNWYNKTNISALGTAGWDIADNKWFNAKEILPAAVANQPKVKFKFQFASDASGTNEGFAIDDIKIYDAPTDAGVTAIVDPVSNCFLSKEQPVTITIKNFGLRTIKASDTLFASIQLDNDSIITNTFIVSSPIAIGGSDDFTFTGTFDMFDKKTYNLKATVSAKGDTAFYGTNNNTKLASVSIWGEPNFSLGPDIGTLTPENETIDAGTGFTTYNWLNHNNLSTATGRIYNVQAFPTGIFAINYSVIAVNTTHNCTSYDTIRVMKSISDLSVTNVTGLSNTCMNGQTGQNIAVTLMNVSKDTTYQSGNELIVGCEIDENNILYDTIILSDTLGQNQSIIHNFSKSIIYPKYGEFEVKVYPQLYGDLDFLNDTFPTNISVYAPADIEFGTDTIYTLRADTITLDVGENLKDIHWLGSATAGNRTYSITTKHSAKYFAEATDLNDCHTDSDTIYIVGDSWKLESVTPNDMCEPSASEYVKIKIKNASLNSYNAGAKTIKATLVFEGITLNEDIVIPAMTAGEVITHTFSHDFSMNDARAYPIDVRIFPKDDINKNDNYIIKNINVWGIREINLGNDIATKKADTIILNPGTYFNSYLWQDGSTKATYQINKRTSDKYWVTAEDANNCSASSDTIQIFATDISMVNISSPSKSCDVNSLKVLKFTIENVGNDIIYADDSITVSYQVDSRQPQQQVYIFKNDLTTGSKLTISLNDNFDFDANTTHNFLVTINHKNDFFTENNSASSTVYQLAVPSVNLGPDVYTSQGDTILLTAPSGYSSYKWQDGSRQETFDITNTGSYAYWVKVTNDVNCSTTDTVKIIAGDVVLVSVTGIEEDKCTGTIYSDTISVGYNLTYNIAVTGVDTLRSGQSLRLLYSTNNGYTEYKNIILSDNYYAGKNYQYSFQDKMVRKIGNYDFFAQVQVSNDFNLANNIYETSFDIGPFDIGLPDSIQTIDEYVELNANSGFNSYNWNTGEKTQSITIYDNGTYYVEAMPNFNCPSTDNTNVKFNGNRAKSTLANINANTCIDPNPIIPEIILQNIGDSTWQVSSPIKYIYTFNNGTQYSENKTLTSTKNLNDTIMHTLSQSILLDNVGLNTLRIHAEINNETVSDKTFNIEVLDYPDFSFGSDTIYVSSYPATLNPNIDNVSYQWSTGATTKTISVSGDATYNLTVTNAGGCQDVEKVTTRLGSRIVETFENNVKIYPNPTSNKLYISIPNMFKNVNIQIADISGRYVFVDKIPDNGSQIIEVSNWEPGVYIVRIYNNNKQSIHRIVVSK